MGVDNDAVLRRKFARTRQLGDYVAALPNQVISTRGIAQRGPLTSPTIPAAAPTDSNSLLQQIAALLSNLPVALSDEFRTRFIMQPRESVSFLVPGENTSVANSGQPVAIVSFKVNQNFTGFLTHVGVNVSPSGGFPSIAWQIRVNNSVHPNFANRVFSVSNMSTPYPFALELVQNRTITLYAINTGSGSLDVSGVLLGWTEFLADYKPYGTSSQSGIA